MPSPERIYRRLRHADVALDADDDYLGGRTGREVVTKGGPHAESGLVDFLDSGREVELGASWAEAGGILGGGVDGDGEYGGGAEELLGGEDSGGVVSMWRLSDGGAGLHLVIFPYCWAELLLDVADAVVC